MVKAVNAGGHVRRRDGSPYEDHSEYLPAWEADALARTEFRVAGTSGIAAAGTSGPPGQATGSTPPVSTAPVLNAATSRHVDVYTSAQPAAPGATRAIAADLGASAVPGPHGPGTRILASLRPAPRSGSLGEYLGSPGGGDATTLRPRGMEPDAEPELSQGELILDVDEEAIARMEEREDRERGQDVYNEHTFGPVTAGTSPLPAFFTCAQAVPVDPLTMQSGEPHRAQAGAGTSTRFYPVVRSDDGSAGPGPQPSDRATPTQVWSRFHDAATGNEYFHCFDTQTSVWRLPPGGVCAQDSLTEPPPAMGGARFGSWEGRGAGRRHLYVTEAGMPAGCARHLPACVIDGAGAPATDTQPSLVQEAPPRGNATASSQEQSPAGRRREPAAADMKRLPPGAGPAPVLLTAN